MKRHSVIAACIVLVCRSHAFALNPTLDVSQYAHTSWKTSEGFAEGLIQSIAQTADGYLWLGTEFGLRRFDGVRAVPWEAPAGQHLPSSDIRSLQGSRDGRLWIGTNNGLASWKDGKLTHYPDLDGQIIEALLEDSEGTVWVAGWALPRGRLCRIQGGNTECHGEDGRFGSGVTPLYEDGDSHLWAGGMTGVWRWKPGPATLYPMRDPSQRIYALIESGDGGILIATHNGITKLRNGKSEAYPLPAGFQPHRLLRDHDGGLWISALVDSGLLHVHDGRTDRFNQAQGLSGMSVKALFEDRERNIWVATADGLDRFRDFAIPTFSDQQGFSSRGILSVLTARDGSLWLGTSEGLDRWNKGDITVYRNRGSGVRGGSPVSRLTAGRGADSRDTVRDITDSGLPGKADSLFQDGRGQLWGRNTKRGCLSRVQPICVCTISTVRNRLFFRRGLCRKCLDESSGRPVPLTWRACDRTDPVGHARPQPTGDGARAGCGTESSVAWISRRRCRLFGGRSASRIVRRCARAGRGLGPRVLHRCERDTLGRHGGWPEPDQGRPHRSRSPPRTDCPATRFTG